MIIFCEAESHEGYGFVETVGNHGNERVDNNEGNEGSVHDGDTPDSDDDSGSLETRNNNKKQQKTIEHLEQKAALEQQKVFDQFFSN